MSKVPTIPDFNPSLLPEIAEAVKTLKLAMEILGGLRQGEALGAPLIFVQGNEPMVEQRTRLRLGDLWINSTINKMNFWNGDRWVQLL